MFGTEDLPGEEDFAVPIVSLQRRFGAEIKVGLFYPITHLSYSCFQEIFLSASATFLHGINKKHGLIVGKHLQQINDLKVSRLPF